MNSLRYSCYLLTIDQVSTDHRPSVDQLLTDTSVKYQRTIGEVSAKSRRSVSEVSVNEKHDRLSSEYRPSLDRLSTDYRPLYRPTIDRYIDRLSIAISTECRPTTDRPLYRPIDRSTLPTVNAVECCLSSVESTLTSPGESTLGRNEHVF